MNPNNPAWIAARDMAMFGVMFFFVLWMKNRRGDDD